MKKAYQQPETTQIQVSLQQMIAGTGQKTDIKMDFSGETGDTETWGDSRRSVIWDEEE